MPIIVTDLQDDFNDAASKMLTTFIIGAIVMVVIFIVLAFCIISGRRKSMGGSVKEAEKSVYFSGYGEAAKKKTKKEKQIQIPSSKSTKVCNTCGSFIQKDLEICSSCGSNEFQYQDS